MRPIPVDLKNGKARVLGYPAASCKRLEREVFNGRGVFNMLVDYLEAEPPVYMVSGLLWAGLLWKEPTLQQAEVDALLDAYVDGDKKRRFVDLWIPIGEALLEAGLLRRADEKAPDANPQMPAMEESSPSPAGSH